MAARARRGRPTRRSPRASIEPDHEPEGHQPEEPGQRIRGEEHPHTRAGQRELVGPVAAARSSAASRCATPRVGRDEHAGTREACSPAEVEVLGARERRGIEALELLEEVGAHEHGRGGDVEDVAHTVVLLLIDLAGFDPGEGRAEAVDGAADLEQDLGVVGADELRSEDAGVGPVGLLHQHAQRVLVECHVVVAQEEEGGALDRVEGLVGRAGEPAPSSRRRTNARGSTSATRGVGSSFDPQSTTSTVRSS